MSRLLMFLRVLIAAALAAAAPLKPAQTEPFARDPELHEARGARERRQHEKALHIYQALTKRFPDNTVLWIEQAQAAAGAGKDSIALQSLHKARKLKPDSMEEHLIAMVYQDLKKYDRTLKILNRLIRRYPANAVFLKDRGVCHYLMGNPARAVKSLQESIRLDSKLMPSYMSLAAVYQADGFPEEAARVYRAALDQGEFEESAEIRKMLENLKKLRN